jgi:hypothetical protein
VLQEIIEAYLASGTSANLNTPTYTRTGEYNPHRGLQLAEADQKDLAQVLTSRGMKLCHDGRFNGPCLFHSCDCPGALYVSGRTGGWYCFCSDHPGNNHGGVSALADLGFIPAESRETMSWAEVQEAVSHDPVQPFYHPSPEDVPKIVNTNNPSYYFQDKPFKPRKRGNLKPSALWNWCLEQFPVPKGVKPKVKSAVLLNRDDCQFVIADLYSTTWFNRANEMHKKCSLLMHLIRTFSKSDSYYRFVPADDWSEKKHEAITKSIERAGGGRYYAIDNQLSRGFWFYIATARAPGFDPVNDLVTLLLEAVKGIRVPNEIPQGGKFRPTRASRALSKLEDKPLDDDAGKLELVASKRGETDFALVEANLRELGRPYQYIDPIFRSMPWQGIKATADPVDPYQDVLDLAVAMGYTLHRKSQAKSTEVGAS